MKKTYNKIAKLPPELLVEIDRKLRDCWELTSISRWLVVQTADRDIPTLGIKAGDPYALAWSRDQTSKRPVEWTCRQALDRWVTISYGDWLRERGLYYPPRYDYGGYKPIIPSKRRSIRWRPS